MSFDRVAPQVVRSTDGWTVQIGGRYHVEYVEDDRLAIVKADLDSAIVRLHGQSVLWSQPNQVTPTQDECDLVLARVTAGLRAMGVASEVVE